MHEPHRRDPALNYRTIAHRGAALALSLTLACAGIPSVGLAQDANAGSIDELRTQAEALVAKIENTTLTYREAAEAVEEIERQIAQNEQRAHELEAQLPAQRASTAASIKSMYLFQQSSGSLLELILSSESFNDFLATVRYIDAIHSRNVEQINNLTAMVDELSQTQAMLIVERDSAKQKQDEALAALEDARSAKAELQAHAIAIAVTEEDNREEAIAVAKAAIDAANTASAELPTFTTSSGNQAVIEVPEAPTVSVTTEPLVNNTTSAETTDWASRINEYLKGSPLEGYGSTFAEAAATYGVDPRLSPAIATIESGKGSICFMDHNAWGWGSSSWDDWESAIYEQVQGLATGYDGTLTLEGAERYCPPNYQEWYSSVASEMDDI